MTVWGGRRGGPDGALRGPCPHVWGSAGALGTRAPCPRGSAPPRSAPSRNGGTGTRDPEIARPGGGEGGARTLPPVELPSRADFLEGERDINQEIKKKKFLHIFKTHVALSEVLFILTKSGGTCPRSGEADGAINHGRRGCLRCPRRSCHSFCLRF